MTSLTIPRPARRAREAGLLGVAVADADWFTTAHLFAEVRREGVTTLRLSCMDYRNAWQKRLPARAWWGELREVRPGLWDGRRVLPPGWMKRFPRLGMLPIARTVAAWRRRIPVGPLALVITYPHYLYLRDLVRPDYLVYLNLDDYTLYWPDRADELAALERRAVREADVTACVARVRAEALQRAEPGAAGRIRHLPHGTPSAMLSERPHHRPGPPPEDLRALPRPWLGYVGSLEDRVDWELLDGLAGAMPGASVVLIGRPAPAGASAWSEARRRCLARSNVHALGWRPQAEIARYNAAFDVGLIPYRLDHPFNRACCPTKIMDSMGTGRPIVATSLPECRLYAGLFDVAEDAPGFVAAVRSLIERGSDDGRAAARHAWAREHTCERVAERLLGWLPD